jgi:hypothetical protein
LVEVKVLRNWKGYSIGKNKEECESELKERRKGEK